MLIVPTKVEPVPVNVTDLSAVVTPTSPNLIVPEPLLTLSAYVPAAVATSPSITPIVRLLFVVVMVTSLNSCVERDVPLRSTAPVVVMFPRSLLRPVPVNVRLESAVEPPTIPISIMPLELPTWKL